MKQFLVSFSTATFLFIASFGNNSSAFAQGGPDRASLASEIPPPLRGLSLSQEQKIKFAEMRKKHRSSIEEQRKIVNAKRDAYEKLFAGNANEAELRKNHAELQALNSKLMEMHFENSLEMRALLTPEQRTQMITQMGQHQMGFPGEGRGNGSGMGHGKGKGRHSGEQVDPSVK